MEARIKYLNKVAKGLGRATDEVKTSSMPANCNSFFGTLAVTIPTPRSRAPNEQ